VRQRGLQNLRRKRRPWRQGRHSRSLSSRKRKKIDRNPRVKHREKYRKALAKRKSRVQEFKEGPQGKYGGESSGFRAGIIRSTALN